MRGLQENTSPLRLKINLKVTRDKLFHVHLFDLYSATQRRGFIKDAASELYVPEDLIKQDLGCVLSELEDLPKLGQHLPKNVLSTGQAVDVFAAIDLESRLGLRDRAILEVLYSTGIRRMELLNLKLTDIDEERGVLTVRQGKGKRDRVVPIGQRAMRWLNKYVDGLRPKLLVSDDEQTVFLTRLGDAFSASSLSALVTEYVRKFGVAVEGSCHLFRHAMATAMHDRGADIRIVQEMLWHVKLDTTQIYTRVSVEKLKAIHSQTHPAFC